MIHLRVVCLEQTFDLTPSNSSSLGRVDANITLRSLVHHFFSCHTLIIQFRRRKCKAEMRLFFNSTSSFLLLGRFFNQIGRGCAVSHPRPSCYLHIHLAILWLFPSVVKILIPSRSISAYIHLLISYSCIFAQKYQ